MTIQSKVEEILKPFIDKYDPVGSGIDNVHYWWISKHFTEAINKALTETANESRREGYEAGYAQGVFDTGMDKEYNIT